MITLSPAPAAVAAAQTWTSRSKALTLRRPALPPSGYHARCVLGPSAHQPAHGKRPERTDSCHRASPGIAAARAAHDLREPRAAPAEGRGWRASG